LPISTQQTKCDRLWNESYETLSAGDGISLALLLRGNRRTLIVTQQISQTDIDSALAAARAAIRENWRWFLGLGIVFVLAGFGAIAFPFLTTIAAKVALGWIFMIGGGVTVAHAFSAMGWRGFLLNFLIGALYLVAGAWLAFLPFTGIITLTILLAALFLAEGVLEMIMAIRVRPHEGWSWLLLSGLIAIAVGLMIGLGLPGSATWAIGLLVGVNLLSTGISFITLALAGRGVGARAVTAS
jgi:uncharacterized membrane protein HdeD (DUF308 family)